MINFKEHLEMRDYQQLDEKLIMYNQGKKYGQVVFLAGGAGSGKGFAQKQFMEGDKFKVFDVDELKKLFIKVRDLKMDLRNPEDVSNLHMMVKKSGVKDARLNLLAKSLSQSKSKANQERARVVPDDILQSKSQSKSKETLPNLMFDVTLKEIEDIKEIMPMLNALGYDGKNIHVTWVLTDYYVAVKANQERERVVSDDIMLLTHIGASQTMTEIIKGKLPRGVNGEVRVILNNRRNTIPWTDANGNVIKGSGSKEMVIKDFTYVTLKKSGKKFMNDAAVQKQVFNWIQDNVPKDALRQIDIPKQ
eukprot:GHVR01126343.1.p1 GENE.GHVR01126343.1~~GHVR01126343.1.p1  ORF type:complete len:305 (+),score=25.92 GHVR01126343.1:75-989(+)